MTTPTKTVRVVELASGTQITVQPQSTSASYVHKHDNASDSDDDTIEPVSFRGLTRSEMLNTRKRLRWTPEDRKTMSRFAVKQAIVSQNRNRDLDRQVREILVPAIFEGERDWEQHKKSAKVLAELTQRTANALTYHMQRNLRAVPMVDGKMVWPEWTKSWLDESWDGDTTAPSATESTSTKEGGSSDTFSAKMAKIELAKCQVHIDKLRGELEQCFATIHIVTKEKDHFKAQAEALQSDLNEEQTRAFYKSIIPRSRFGKAPVAPVARVTVSPDLYDIQGTIGGSTAISPYVTSSGDEKQPTLASPGRDARRQAVVGEASFMHAHQRSASPAPHPKLATEQTRQQQIDMALKKHGLPPQWERRP